jgi:hypothetical protein
MKVWKYGIIIVSLGMLMLSSAVVSAEIIDDGQNDVLKANADGTYVRGQTMNVIDVDKITYTFSGDKLTLEYKIVGPFQQTGDYMYYAIVTTTDFSYSVRMNDYGNADAMVVGTAAQDYNFEKPECVVGENTLTAEFQTQGDTTIVEAFGWATFVNNPVYTDWAPDSRGPEGSFGEDTSDDTGSDDSGDDDEGSDNNPKTPGFELIAVIAAVGVALILLKRRK